MLLQITPNPLKIQRKLENFMQDAVFVQRIQSGLFNDDMLKYYYDLSNIELAQLKLKLVPLGAALS